MIQKTDRFLVGARDLKSRTINITDRDNQTVTLSIVHELPAGSHTAPKLVKLPDGRDAVYKAPRAQQHQWQQMQWARDVTTQLHTNDIIRDFDGALQIPRILNYKTGPDGYILEEYVPGTTLDNSRLMKMTPPARHELATELAEFLNSVHQKTVQRKPSRYQFASRLDEYDKNGRLVTPASTRVYDKIISAIPDAAPILHAAFAPENTTDDYTVLTHNDIRASNIVMRPDGKFALIDFGNARHTNKYHDMVPFATAPNLKLLPILLDAASVYNTLAKPSAPIYYSPEIIKNLFIRNTILLFGYDMINTQANTPEIRKMWQQNIMPQINEINDVYNYHMSKQIESQSHKSRTA